MQCTYHCEWNFQTTTTTTSATSHQAALLSWLLLCCVWFVASWHEISDVSRWPHRIFITRNPCRYTWAHWIQIRPPHCAYIQIREFRFCRTVHVWRLCAHVNYVKKILLARANSAKIQFDSNILWVLMFGCCSAPARVCVCVWAVFRVHKNL